MVITKDAATLVAALIAAAVSVLNLVLSEINRRAQIRLDHQLRGLAEDKKRSIESIQERLSQFYEPLAALLVTNSCIFERIGPTSPARTSEDYDDEELAETWKRLVEKVILPNNRRICEIIETKSHLIAREDSDRLYQDFLVHAYSYETFRQAPSSAHRLFPFPKELLNRVEHLRNALRAQFERVNEG
jgi:hypothetical protein